MPARATVAVLDYGVGNLHSVCKALQRVAPRGVAIRLSRTPQELRAAGRIVFPGVGAMRDCMGGLHSEGLAEALGQLAGSRPMLAICVGMQALVGYSEENDGVPCLDLLPGRCRFFGLGLRDGEGRALKVPHMGWSRVHTVPGVPLWEGLARDPWFYFAHSYYVETEAAYHAGRCQYGLSFPAALAHEGLFAVQFHPEKSQGAGLRLLQNFLHWEGG